MECNKMVKNFFVFSFIGFCILSCDRNPSSAEWPKGFNCQCEQSGSLKPINAPSVKEAQDLCKKGNGKIKSCAKNQ